MADSLAVRTLLSQEDWKDQHKTDIDRDLTGHFLNCTSHYSTARS